MKFFKKMFVLFLSTSILFIQFPNAAFAKDYAKANASTKVTENAPQICLSPGKSIPPAEETAPPMEINSNLLTLIAISIAAALGAAAGGASGGEDSCSGDTGSLTGSW